MTHLPKLIGLDLDGTVVGDDNEIPEVNLRAIRECHHSGIKLAFLTGRRPLTAKKHLDTIGVPCYVATNSGCLRWKYPGWKQLERRMFPRDLLIPVAELLAPHSANFHLDSSEAGYEFIHLARTPNPALEHYMSRYGKNTLRLTDASLLPDYNITQVAMPAENPAVVRALHKQVCSQFDGKILAMAVRWPLMNVLALELFHPDANKGSALKDFARRLNIDREDCLAAGDDVNDLPMLKWARSSLAMPSAGTEVVAVASQKLAGEGAEALGEYLVNEVLGD